MPWTKVYIDKREFGDTLAADGGRGLTYREAIREAQVQLMERDPDVYIFGEGVDDPGGIFGTTLGLKEKFGNRVMDIPVAENGLTGVSIGSALAGLKPIFVHMRMDFLPMCMDQIINHAAKWHYMTGGRVNVALVIRTIIGRGWGSAAQHSQALHSLFTAIPGLRVVMPATPYDVKGLLMAAVHDGNPTVFCEHRWAYDHIGYVPAEPYEVPLGKGLIRRSGKDVTLVGISYMVYEAVKAARVLEREGIELEVIDPRTLKPLDIELIRLSVKKTGRLIIADVGCKNCGMGAEIVAEIMERECGLLRAPIRRVCLPDTPTPAGAALERLYYPDHHSIINAVRELVGRRKPVAGIVPLKEDRLANNPAVSIIIPALNEEANIVPAVTNALRSLDDCGIPGEVVVVNDGSSDSTEQLVDGLMNRDGRVRMLKHNTPKGIGTSFWDGVDDARGESIVMLPGDNENDPWEILRYYPLLDNVDLVIPFTFNMQTRSSFRKALSLIYRFIVNATFRVDLNYTNGTVLYRSSILRELDQRSGGFFFQTDILVRVVKRGYLFAEVPYKLGRRNAGASKALTFSSLLQVAKGYLCLAKEYCFTGNVRKNDFAVGTASARRYGNDNTGRP